MSDSRRRVVAVAISTFAILAAGPGYAQLKPKVRVLTNATAPVPPECAQGTVAPPPRVEVPPPAPVSPAPAQGGLSTALRVVQQAAERNDYDAFRSTLAAARSAAASYTRGGERDAAQNVLAIDSDLEQVWDFAQTNRTGAFYGEENRAVMEIARRYGAPPPLRVGGQTLYPTHELREIVTREASKRLAGMGIHVASRSRRTETRVVDTMPAKPRRTPSTKIVEAQPATPRPQTHKHRATSPSVIHIAGHATAPHKSHTKKPAAPPTQAAAAAPPPAPRKSVAAPPTHVAVAVPPPAPRKSVPAPPTATVAPAPVPASVPAPAPVPQPMTATTATVAPASAPITTTATPPPVTETQTASTETSSTSGTDTLTTTTTTAATDTTATTGSAPAPHPATSGRSNLALRIFVVLIAIGLLIALFRASS